MLYLCELGGIYNMLVFYQGLTFTYPHIYISLCCSYMKRLIAIPLLILYLTAVSGAMIQIHYCGSKIASWIINKSVQSCCCEAGGHKKPASSLIEKKDCCSNKTITLKIAETQNSVSKATGFLSGLGTSASIPVIIPHDIQFYTPAIQHIGYRSNAPPGRWQNIPLYKLHSSFTYYS